MLERFLLLWLTLLSVLAYFWTAWFPGWWDPFVGSAGVLKYLFAVTMLAIGSLLPEDEILQVARRWPTVLGGTAIQYTAMPLLAYGVGHLFGLEGPWLVGCIMVGCVPGAMASNVLTLTARGNVSYSLSLTTSATLLSPLIVPMVLWIALREWVEFPAAKVSLDLTWMVVLPVVAGHLLSRRFTTWNRVAGRVGAIIANLTILWIIAVVVGKNRESLVGLDASFLATFLSALLAINLGGYAAGMLGGLALRLPDPMRRALTLEVGMQNAGLGAVLANDLFGKHSAGAIEAVGPAVYTFGCMFTGTLLARYWASRTGPLASLFLG